MKYITKNVNSFNYISSGLYEEKDYITLVLKIRVSFKDHTLCNNNCYNGYDI